MTKKTIDKAFEEMKVQIITVYEIKSILGFDYTRYYERCDEIKSTYRNLISGAFQLDLITENLYDYAIEKLLNFQVPNYYE